MSRGQSESGLADIETLEQLLARTALRDRAAFESLYHRTSPRLFGLCMRMLRERSEAEEVLQKVFISVWRRAQGYNPESAIAPLTGCGYGGQKRAGSASIPGIFPMSNSDQARMSR